jgi:DNA-binding MarR family transcriptional regulator
VISENIFDYAVSILGDYHKLLFEALNPTELRVLEAIALNGAAGLGAIEIARKVKVSDSAIYRYLSKLRDINLILKSGTAYFPNN